MRLSPTCAMKPWWPTTRRRESVVPMPRLAGVGLRLFVDLRAGALHRVLEQGDDVLRRDLARAGRRRRVVVEQLLLALDLFVDGADGDRARDLARRVAAHPVGDDEERELLVDEEVVLVVVADLADVGRRVETDGVAQPHLRFGP